MMSISEILNRPILDIIARYENLTRQNKDNVLDSQAYLFAIYKARLEQNDSGGRDLFQSPRMGTHNFLILQAEMARLHVSNADIEAARRTVVMRNGMPSAVPLIGKLAADMGFITHELLDALVCAQAGAQILAASQRIRRLCEAQLIADDNVLTALIFDGYETDSFARDYIGRYDDDSKACVGTQAFAHLADITACLPEAQAHSDVLDIIGYACLRASAYKLVALHYLSDAWDIMGLIPDQEIEINVEKLIGWRDFLHDSLDQSAFATKLISTRWSQADLSVILSGVELNTELGLMDALRRCLSTAK
jgi:hypothetical protein